MTDQMLEGLPAGRLFASVPEFVTMSGYDQLTVRKGITAGEIPAMRVGRTWRIPTSWIRAQALAVVGGTSDAA